MTFIQRKLRCSYSVPRIFISTFVQLLLLYTLKVIENKNSFIAELALTTRRTCKSPIEFSSFVRILWRRSLCMRASWCWTVTHSVSFMRASRVYITHGTITCLRKVQHFHPQTLIKTSSWILVCYLHDYQNETLASAQVFRSLNT